MSTATCGSSNCNGHGVCSTLNQAYQQFTSLQNQVLKYDGWETNHVTMCVCDFGEFGEMMLFENVMINHSISCWIRLHGPRLLLSTVPQR